MRLGDAIDIVQDAGYVINKEGTLEWLILISIIIGAILGSSITYLMIKRSKLKTLQKGDR